MCLNATALLQKRLTFTVKLTGNKGAHEFTVKYIAFNCKTTYFTVKTRISVILQLVTGL